MASIKERLRQLRKEKGKWATQGDIANEIGLPRGTYASYENGITPPTDVFIRMADYYDVSLDYLAGLTNERHNAAGDIPAALAAAAREVGADSLQATELVDLLNAVARYYRQGAICGDIPVMALRGYIQGLTNCLDAASSADFQRLCSDADAAVIAALGIARMPALAVMQKEE